MKAFLYARKSQEDAKRQILSLDAQIEEGTKTAEIGNIEVLKVFKESRSAKKPNNRPIFTEMMSRVYKGHVNCLIVWKLDRLARNPLDAAAVMMALQDGMIESIVTPMRTYHKNDNVLLMQIEFGMANQYIRDLSQNVKRGMRTKAGKGGWNHQAPMGYKNDKGEKTVVLDEKQAPYIKKMFEMRAKGESCYEISRKLYQIGFRSRNGNKVQQNKINKHIKNPFYKGLVPHEGEWIDGAHEAIVSASLWRQAQKEKPAGARSKRDFPLLGLFECGECGCSITAEKQKDYVYYRCTKKRGDCSQPYLRDEKLEDLLLKFFNKLNISDGLASIISDDVTEKFDNINGEKKELTRRYDSKIKSLEKELDTLLEMRKGGELDRDEYLKEKKKCGTKIENLMGERFENREELTTKLEEIVEWLELMKAFGLWAKGIGAREWRNLLNSFGSNFYIKDKGFSLSGKTPLFEAIVKENDVWSGRRDVARTFDSLINVFLDDFKSIKNILEIKRRLEAH